MWGNGFLGWSGWLRLGGEEVLWRDGVDGWLGWGRWRSSESDEHLLLGKGLLLHVSLQHLWGDRSVSLNLEHLLLVVNGEVVKRDGVLVGKIKLLHLWGNLTEDVNLTVIGEVNEESFSVLDVGEHRVIWFFI